MVRQKIFLISDKSDIEKFCKGKIGTTFSLHRFPVKSDLALYEQFCSDAFCVIINYNEFSQVDLIHLFSFIHDLYKISFVLLAYGNFALIDCAEDLLAWNSKISSWQELEKKLAPARYRNISGGGELEVTAFSDDTLQYQIECASKDDSPVLILGPSGCGKTYTARKIYSLSSRKSGPFVTVNAAEFNSNLIESELFGSTRGAFTGAVEKDGLFAASDGGILFFDEIAELPFNLQAKLLRVIETKSYHKVGSYQERKFDSKLIFATNAPLSLYIKEQKFRFDLFQRISTITVNLLPLRNRFKDIESLAIKFAGQHKKVLSQSAIQKLLSYQWPGNIRELKNVIDRACTFCKENVSIIDSDQIYFMNVFPL